MLPALGDSGLRSVTRGQVSERVDFVRSGEGELLPYERQRRDLRHSLFRASSSARLHGFDEFVAIAEPECIPGAGARVAFGNDLGAPSLGEGSDGFAADDGGGLDRGAAGDVLAAGPHDDRQTGRIGDRLLPRRMAAPAPDEGDQRP